MLLDDYGYCELEFPEYCVSWMKYIFQLVRESGVPLSLEASPSSLEELARRGYDNFIEEIRELAEKGLLEIVNGTYSLPYLTLIGYESNIMQFAEGLKIFKKLLGTAPKVYLATEFALHPQLPQILAKLGYELAVARARLNGTPPQVDEEAVLWNAPDGSSITAIPQYESVPIGESYSGRFYLQLPSMISKAAKSKLSLVIFENYEDAIYPVAKFESFAKAWKEGILPIEMGTFQRILGKLKPSQRMFRPSWEEYRMYLLKTPSDLLLEGKLAEHALLAAEAIQAFASLLGISIDAVDSLNHLWRQLMRAQHHDAYVVPYCKQGDYMGSRARVYGEYQGPTGTIDAYTKSMQLFTHVREGSLGIVRRALLRIAQKSLQLKPDNIAVFNPLAWDAEVRFRIVTDREDIRSIEGPAGARPIKLARQGKLTIIEARYPLKAPSAAALKLRSKPAPELAKASGNELETSNLQIQARKRQINISTKTGAHTLKIEGIDFIPSSTQSHRICAEARGKEYKAILWGPEGVLELQLKISSDTTLEISKKEDSAVYADYPFGVEKIEKSSNFTYYVTIQSEEGALQMVCPSAMYVEAKKSLIRIPLRAGVHRIWILPAGNNPLLWLKSVFTLLAPSSIAITGAEGEGRENAVQPIKFRGTACITSIKPHRKGILLRAVNYSHQPGELDVETPLGPCEASLLSPDGAKEIRSINMPMRLKPWEITTLGVHILSKSG